MEKKRVLLVDDEKGFTSMLSLNLESTGDYEVRVENNSANVISTALQFRPEIILLDVVMPNMEGPDVANAVKQNKDLEFTPIIYLTATVTQEEVDAQGGKIGGHPFVAKPSNLSDLVYTIEKTILASKR